MFYGAAAWYVRYTNCGHSSSHAACSEFTSYASSTESNYGPPAAWVRKDNACDAAVPPANGAAGTCSDTLASGSSCQPTCDAGYTVSGTSSCLNRVLTSATCSPPPCDASSPPDNGAVGDCTSSLASGSSCTPSCDSGYTLSGTRSCSGRHPHDTAVCNPNPCDAAAAIANGALNDCTSTLAHGTSCTPDCNTGYTLSGTRSCSAGTLTNTAVCNPNDCTASPDNPNKNGDDGVFYCINDGTVSGTTGSCVCSGCKAGYGGASCETAGACSASTDPSKDGTDDTIYCINTGNTGGIAGGTAGACTCTCKPGHEGNGCDTASACTASSGLGKGWD